jgi:hypothetical protein
VLVDCHCERESGTVIANDVDGIFGGVTARDDAVEVDQRCAMSLGLAEADIVSMVWIRPFLWPAISIAEQPVFAEGIIIRSLLPLKRRHRRDAQRQTAKSWLEDTARTEQRNTLTFEGKARGKALTIEEICSEPSLFVEERKGGKTDPQIGIIHGNKIVLDWFDLRSYIARRLSSGETREDVAA